MQYKSPRILFGFVLTALMFLAACSVPMDEPAAQPAETDLETHEASGATATAVPQATATPVPARTQPAGEPGQPPHPEPTITPHPIEEARRDPVERAVEDLARRLDVPEDEITVVRVYGDDFVGDNLGCPGGKTPLRPIPALVTGQVIELEAGGQIHVYHAAGAELVYCPAG